MCARAPFKRLLFVIAFRERSRGFRARVTVKGRIKSLPCRESVNEIYPPSLSSVFGNMLKSLLSSEGKKRGEGEVKIGKIENK